MTSSFLSITVFMLVERFSMQGHKNTFNKSEHTVESPAQTAVINICAEQFDLQENSEITQLSHDLSVSPPVW